MIATRRPPGRAAPGPRRHGGARRRQGAARHAASAEKGGFIRTTVGGTPVSRWSWICSASKRVTPTIREEAAEQPGARLGDLVEDERGAGKLGEDRQQPGPGRGSSTWSEGTIAAAVLATSASGTASRIAAAPRPRRSGACGWGAAAPAGPASAASRRPTRRAPPWRHRTCAGTAPRPPRRRRRRSSNPSRPRSWRRRRRAPSRSEGPPRRSGVPVRGRAAATGRRGSGRPRAPARRAGRCGPRQGQPRRRRSST